MEPEQPARNKRALIDRRATPVERTQLLGTGAWASVHQNGKRLMAWPIPPAQLCRWHLL